MVALFNGMGAGAAAAIAAPELFGSKNGSTTHLLVTLGGALIGSVSFSGSLIAWAKLDGRIEKTWRVKGQQALNGIVFLATLVVGCISCLRCMVMLVTLSVHRSSSAPSSLAY